MTVTRYVPLRDIRRRLDARAIDRDNVERIKRSIAEVGLLSPVVVRPLEGDAFELIAGNHRFIATQELGEADILAIDVADLGDLHAELAMIDENLIRAELSPAERSVQIARRKAIYEELHPETKHGAIGNGREPSRQLGDSTSSSKNKPVDRFTAETAAATGRSERAVQRDAERGEKVIPDALDMVRGTKLDTGAYLDKLKRLAPNEQVHAVKHDLAAPRQDPRTKQGGIAARVDQKPEPTYDQLRKAILFLADLKPADFTRLCPPNKRAAMCQKLAHLEQVFEQVREAASA